MRLEALLDALHARAVRHPWLRLFTAMTRGLLAVGFIVPSMPKLLGNRFSQIPVTHPVGYFFDAFFQAQAYYFAVGLAQLTAGLLLLFATTATLGAVLYFPIILNIFLITVSIGFQGTQLVSGLMLLASTYLLAWDYDRWKALLPGFGVATPAALPPRHLSEGMTVLTGGIAGVSGLGLAYTGLALLEGRGLGRPLLALGLGLAAAAVLGLRYRRGLAAVRAQR